MKNQILSLFLLCLTVTVYATDDDDTIECKLNGVYLIKHPNLCNQYYICMNGKPSLQSCASGYHYDPNGANCILEAKSDCVDAFTSLCPLNSARNVEFIAYPPDCSKYLLCNNGEGALLECADGLLFDPHNKYCSIASSVNCDGQTGNIPQEVICPSIGVAELAHPTDCSLFYVCVNSEIYQYKCTNGLVYDIKTGRCNNKLVSKCFKN